MNHWLRRLAAPLLLVWLSVTSGLTTIAVAQLPGEPAAPSRSTADEDLEANSAVNEGPASGLDRTTALVGSLTIFVLAVFVGFEIITKVPPTLHTPLMSGSNAISGITLVGALLVTGGAAMATSRLWGFLAIVLATINVVGGFLVTHRMLAMFSKPKR